MQAPDFWSAPRGKGGLAAKALTPLSWIWRFGTERRLASGKWHRLDAPVICVGNLTVGGTGKTPTVSFLQEYLGGRGMTPHVISRGYRGSETGPLSVDLARHDAGEVGDEPLLLAAFGPTWVSKDRKAGAEAAIAAGADIILLDDGFQNPGLHKDLSVIVVDAETGFGNGRILPAGPLREPLTSGIERADLILSLGPDAAQDRLTNLWPELNAKPRVSGHLAPLATGMQWTGLRVLAFAGIGRPEKFFRTLERCGADVVRTRSFSDHASYGQTILDRLEAEAKELGAQLVTTEKDAVRLPAAFRSKVLTLPVRLALDDVASFEATLERALAL